MAREDRLGRPITAMLVRRRTPLWGRFLFGTLAALAMGWFLFGGAIRNALRGTALRVAPAAGPVDIEFGPSDADVVEGLRAYYRYEYVPIRIRIRDRAGQPVSNVEPDAKIFLGDLQVKDAGKRREVPLEYDTQTHEWRGNWIPPLGSPAGVYRLECSAKLPARCFPDDYEWVPQSRSTQADQPRDPRLRWPERPEGAARGAAGTESAQDAQPIALTEEREFRLAAREPDFPLEGFGAVSWEILSPNVLEVTPKLPNGQESGDWRGVLPWLDLFAPDVFWYSGYITSSALEPLPPGVPWFQPNVEAISPIGEEMHRRGLRFGVYCFAYRMNGPIELLPDYSTPYFNAGVEGGLAVPSLLDDKRVNDLAAMARTLDENPSVDMIGFDYIRDAEPTYDGVDRFVEEVHPPLPTDWASKSPEKRQEWLRAECSKVRDPNPVVMRLWNWWRAHRVAQIVRDVRTRSGAKKPFWAYTLSSLHGQEHGQDPYMLQDAGVDLDAPMLYQMPSTDYFDAVMRTNGTDSWKVYSGKGKLNLAPGNQIDHYWNQQERGVVLTDPPTPLEFYRRMMVALEVCRDPDDRGPMGLFCHDVFRAIGSRYPDPYSGAEWALAGASAMTEVRSQWRSIPVRISLEAPAETAVGETVEGSVTITNISDKTLAGVCAAAFPLPGMRVLQPSPAGPVDIRPGAKATLRLRWAVTSRGEGRSGWLMGATRVTWATQGYFPSATAFRYVRSR